MITNTTLVNKLGNATSSCVPGLRSHTTTTTLGNQIEHQLGQARGKVAAISTIPTVVMTTPKVRSFLFILLSTC
jgi:hypothetical protein